MKKLINLLIIIPLFGFSQWSYKTYKDDFTDELVTISTHEDEIHEIQLNRQGKNNSVWIFITIKDLETFEPNTNVEYRVDNNELIEFNYNNSLTLSKIFDEKFYQWEPKTIGFKLWHGDEEQGYGFIEQLLNGETLKIRYSINSIEKRIINIDLKDSEESIIKGLNLKKYNSNKI